MSSAVWLAVGVFVLLAAVGIHKTVKALRAAAAALDWRVPEAATSTAMFGSRPATVRVNRAIRPNEPVADVDERSQRRVDSVDRVRRRLAA